MTDRRRQEGGQNELGFDGQIEDVAVLAETDAFLTDLSRGVDRSEGEDLIAGLLLELRDYAHADMPAPPTLVDLGLEKPCEQGSEEDCADEPKEFDEHAGDHADDTSMLPVVAEAPDAELKPETETAGDVIDFAAQKQKRQRDHTRRGFGRIASGFVGAAAATLIIAGGGTAVFNAGEGSPLYGLNQRFFGGTSAVDKEHKATVVELASTLEEVTSRTESGDVEGARQLLEQAQEMVNRLNEGDRNKMQPKVDRADVQLSTITVTPPPVTETVTTTITLTPEPSPRPPAPVQVPTSEPNVDDIPAIPSSIAPVPGEPQPPTLVEDRPLTVPEEYRN
ncbi:hypothetical protein P4N68_05350 [Corynebacterium felinum]|uniref:Anti-sigma-D factor RsdA sigma factor binding region domain-containing protein n=1 Tax=Corynebacterium felinum TaxID=131318 RepID=A0ABU2BBI9_9CORY|nr:hypothetical protein [Corynebacterium felinum]MDF5820506.1 hypothetical protein [Corynebacterium felinum]MDR7354754.1 hypothetical protein [Corynebacterium felinum]WJY94117.1 hypothetical protein CFELI_02375 [Corynebacterium felinum]